MQTLTSEVYLEGLVFGECPRWHGGALWLSDMFGGRVLRSTGPGKAETVLTLPGGRPSGLAFLDDGSLLVVSMQDRKLLRRWPDGRVEPFADLAPHVTGDINDMVRAPDGGVFVGNFGFDLFGGAEGRLTNLHHVDAQGRVREVATELNFPNGMVITPDRSTLIVAETFAHRLTAFDIRGGELRQPARVRDAGRLRAGRHLSGRRRRGVGQRLRRRRLPARRAGRQDHPSGADARPARGGLQSWRRRTGARCSWSPPTPTSSAWPGATPAPGWKPCGFRLRGRARPEACQGARRALLCVPLQ